MRERESATASQKVPSNMYKKAMEMRRGIICGVSLVCIAMSLKIAIIACVAVLALADQAPSYGPPPPTSYKEEPDYPDVPPKYTYKYGVIDDYSGTNFEASEARDGYKTEGSYVVDLPDGRKQIVTYIDNGDGLVAEVTYEGEAQYPENNPAPAYPEPPKYTS